MVNIKQYWKEILISILVLVCYLEYAGKNHAEESTKDLQKQVTTLQTELTKTKSEIIQRNQIVTVVTQKPDGTKISETKKTETITKDNSKITVNTDGSSDTTIAHETIKNNMSRYQLGADYAILSRSYNADIAARIGDLPLFGVIRVKDNFHDVAVGLRIEW